MIDDADRQDDSGQETESEETQPDERPGGLSTTHLRPLSHPRLDERRFDTPPRLPETRSPPAKSAPELGEKPEPDAASASKPPAGRVSFPIAKPPPGVPTKPPAEPPNRPSRPAERAPAPEAVRPEPSDEKSTPLESTQPQAIGTKAAAARDTAARRGSLLGFVFYIALAVGTLPLPGDLRAMLLWLVLLGLGGTFLLFDREQPLSGPVDSLNLSWGLGVGFVLSLPLMLTASRALARTSAALIPITDTPALLQALVVTWPLGETLFYRGAVQREHGLVPAALVAGLGNVLLYWPQTGGIFAVLFVAAIFATALAFVYSYVRRQYGLAAAYTCQVMTNLMLILLPRLLVSSA